MTYREEIDGLRALAILPVILYHSGITIFSGGYVGVDVFFVISGFLISSQIIEEKKNNKFSIINFYERRIRRIAPALFFVILVSIPIFWIVMASHQYKDFSESIFATVFFSSNILFWLESGYFETASELKPLLHTWSLAVEEQFYIFIPLLFIIFWNYGKKLLLLVFSLIFLTSFIAMEIVRVNDSDLAFYFLFFRMWELVLGLLIALIINRVDIKDKFKNIISFIGLLFIILPIFIFNNLTPFPSVYTLLPVLGTSLILLFCNKNVLIYQFLNLRILKFIGLISYSAYLWHQPIFVFSRLNNTKLDSDIFLVFLGIASLVVAYLSYKFIETPFRNKKLIGRKNIFALFFLFSVGLAVFGYMGHITNGFYNFKISTLPEVYQSKIINKNDLLEKRSPIWKKILNNSNKAFEGQSSNILILGDSKGQDLYVSLKINNEPDSYENIRYSYLDDKCMFDLSKISKDYLTSDCLAETDYDQTKLLINDAQLIILTATWMQHTYTNALKFVQNPNLNDKKIIILSTGNFYDLPSLTLQIAQNEIPKESINNYLYKNRRLDWKKISEKIKDQLHIYKNVSYKSRFDIFCNDEEYTCNLYSKTDEPYIWDSGHLTIEGAKFQGKKIKELGWFE